MACCKEYEARLELLEDFLAGTLGVAGLEQVCAHLAICSVCREEIEAAREAGGLLRSAFAPAGEPGGAFWMRVRAGIRRAEGKAVPQEFWGSLELLARRLVWTAALVVALLGGYAILTHDVVSPQRVEAREIFPEPSQPENEEEVLLTLAGSGR